jgi:hypothetical protein
MKLSTTFATALVASLAIASPTKYEILITEDDINTQLTLDDNTPHVEGNIPLIDLWQNRYEYLSQSRVFHHQATKIYHRDFLGLKFTGSSTAGTCGKFLSP